MDSGENRIYPFVPDTQFAEVLEPLQKQLRQVQPFRVRIARFGYFKQAKGGVVWAQPESEVRVSTHCILRWSPGFWVGFCVCAFSVRVRAMRPCSQRGLVWMVSARQPAPALADLQAALHKVFPECDEQSSKAGGFHPHLTVAQAESKVCSVWHWLASGLLRVFTCVVGRGGNCDSTRGGMRGRYARRNNARSMCARLERALSRWSFCALRCT